MANTNENVEAALRNYAATQGSTRVGGTIAALLRTDRDRLTYWPGPSVQNLTVQGNYQGDEEMTVFYAAEKYASMRAAIGWVAIDGFPSQSGAWLVVNGGAVIDPAGAGRDALGFLGVELGMVEASRWTPTQRGEVAVRGVAGFAL